MRTSPRILRQLKSEALRFIEAASLQPKGYYLLDRVKILNCEIEFLIVVTYKIGDGPSIPAEFRDNNPREVQVFLIDYGADFMLKVESDYEPSDFIQGFVFAPWDSREPTHEWTINS